MYANPVLYDRSNYLQVRDGAKMIEFIKSQFKGRSQIDTLLDIGCGSGNLTEMLYRELKPKRIVAFDLADAMVYFARNRNVTGMRDPDAIAYYQANACESFESLAEKLQLKPSSVDVVTSFYCIHWVPDKRKTCQNMYRFLKPNGKFYLVNSVWNDLFPVQHRIIEHNYWRPYLMQWVCDMKAGLAKDENPQGGCSRDDNNLVNFEIQHKPNHDALHKFWKKHLLESALVMEEMAFIYTDYPFKQVQDFNGKALKFN